VDRRESVPRDPRRSGAGRGQTRAMLHVARPAAFAAVPAAARAAAGGRDGRSRWWGDATSRRRRCRCSPGAPSSSGALRRPGP